MEEDERSVLMTLRIPFKTLNSTAKMVKFRQQVEGITYLISLHNYVKKISCSHSHRRRLTQNFPSQAHYNRKSASTGTNRRNQPLDNWQHRPLYKVLDVEFH
jgi:hypothetical protein